MKDSKRTDIALYKTNPSLLQSHAIDWLRFPLVVLVVFIHGFGEPWHIDPDSIQANPLTALNLYHLVRISISHVLALVAVPMFFMFSGYYFFHGVNNFDSKTYTTKIKRRIWTLIVPYLSWILIAIIARCIVDSMSGKPFELSDYLGWNCWHLFWDYHRWDESSFNWLGMTTPMTGPYVVSLWFLRDLIIVSLLSPLVYWVVRFTRHYGICLLTCLYVSGIWFDIQGLGITTMFFFSVGAYMSLQGKNLVEQAARVRVISYFVTAILFIVMTWCCGRGTKTGTLLSPFYIIITICAILNLATYLVSTGKVKIIPLLTKSTFFVYASHMILILGFSSWVLTITLGNNYLASMMVKYFATPLLTVAICVILYMLISRFVPWLSKFLNGHR